LGGDVRYRITGTGTVPLVDHKDTLGEAANTASHMADNGVVSVQVFDEAGREIAAEELDAAFIQFWQTKKNT
jgi:hypothetical protein